MKMISSSINQVLLMALCALQGATAFTILPGASKVVTPQRSSTLLQAAELQPVIQGEKVDWDLNSIATPGRPIRCEGGNTRRTFDFPDQSREVVQIGLNSAGRPIHSEIELWIGPNWSPYTLKTYSEDGSQFPVQVLVGTRNKAAQIEVRNVGPSEFPLVAACSYPKSPALEDIRERIPATSMATTVQGSGAVVILPLEAGMEQARVFLNTDSRQLHAMVELLNGPNNVKQKVEVFTNNGVLNSLYVVFNTPGNGNAVRIRNLAPVEFPAYAYISKIS